VVVGEPGAGKSALLDVVRTAAEGMTVLEAKRVQSEATLPFAALHQLLRPAFGLLDRLPAPQASALRAAFALKGGGDPDLYRVPLAVLTLLAEAAEDQSLLCLIDDAQWVDGDSAQALTFAARVCRPTGSRSSLRPVKASSMQRRSPSFVSNPWTRPPSKRFSRPAPARLLLPMSHVASRRRAVATHSRSSSWLRCADGRGQMSSGDLAWRTLSRVSLPPAILCPC
jgi:AAA ATPase domain